MKVQVLCLLLLVIPGYCLGQDLDKSGTRGVPPDADDSQAIEDKGFASEGSFVSERAGFEPAVGFNSYAALAKRCEDSVTTDYVSVSAHVGQSGAAPGAAARVDLELARMIAAWPTLPEPIKAAIRALIGSC